MQNSSLMQDLISLAVQYRSDLKRPPIGDSLERRFARIDELLAQFEKRKTAMNKDEIAGLVRDLRTHAYDDCGGRDISTHIGNQAADDLTTLFARVETLEDALRIRVWNDAMRRGVKQDAAIKEVQEAVQAALGGSNG